MATSIPNSGQFELAVQQLTGAPPTEEQVLNAYNKAPQAFSTSSNPVAVSRAAQQYSDYSNYSPLEKTVANSKYINTLVGNNGNPGVIQDFIDQQNITKASGQLLAPAAQQYISNNLQWGSPFKDLSAGTAKTPAAGTVLDTVPYWNDIYSQIQTGRLKIGTTLAKEPDSADMGGGWYEKPILIDRNGNQVPGTEVNARGDNTYVVNSYAGQYKMSFGIASDPQSGYVIPIQDYSQQVGSGRWDYGSGGLKGVLEDISSVYGGFGPLGMAAIAYASGGASTAIGEAMGLSGTAASVAGNVALNYALNGGDLNSALKAGAGTWLGATAGNYVGDLAKSGEMGDFLKANPSYVSNLAANITKAAVTGGDIKTAAAGALVGAATDTAIKEYFPDAAKLPASIQSAIKSSIAASLQGKDASVPGILKNAALAGVVAYGLNEVPGYADMDPKAKALATTNLTALLQGKDLTQANINLALSQSANEINKAVAASNAPTATETAPAGTTITPIAQPTNITAQPLAPLPAEEPAQAPATEATTQAPTVVEPNPEFADIFADTTAPEVPEQPLASTVDSSNLEEPNVVTVRPDGNVDANGNPTYVDIAGNPVTAEGNPIANANERTPLEGGGFKTLNPNGSITYEDPDGSVYTVNPNGTYTTESMGQTNTYNPATGTFVQPTQTPTTPTTTPTTVPTAGIGTALTGLGLLAGAGALAGGSSGTTTPAAGSQAGTYSALNPYNAAYFQQVQQNYNRLFPTAPADVATPLQSWYDTKYVPDTSISKKLFGV